jgi:hypothetical protein
MKGFGPGLSETDAISFGKYVAAPERHFVPEIQSQDRTKGQPEGPAVTGRTGKPRVAGTDRKTWNAATHPVIIGNETSVSAGESDR